MDYRGLTNRGSAVRIPPPPSYLDLFFSGPNVREASLNRPRSKRQKSSLRNKKKKMEMNRKMDSNQEDILVIYVPV